MLAVLLIAVLLIAVLPVIPAAAGVPAGHDAWIDQATRDADALIEAGEVAAAGAPPVADLRDMLVERLEQQIMAAAQTSLRAYDRERRHEELRLRIRDDIDKKRRQTVPAQSGDILASGAEEETDSALRSASADYERRSVDSELADGPSTVSRLRDDLRPALSAAGDSISSGTRLSDGSPADADLFVTDRDARPTPVRPGRTLIQPAPDNTDSSGAIGSDKPDQTTIRVQPDGSDRNVFTPPGDIRAPGRRTR